jgi:prepilin-type N-terminal cleavage/methylation domain-containing protein
MRITPSRRPGVTLAELLVAMSVLAMVGSAITATVVRQMRAGAALAERTEMRDQLVEGASILAGDLASISSVGGDVFATEMTNRLLGFLATFGASVLCAIPGGSTVLLPPVAPDTVTALTHARKRVDAGHGLYVFDEGPTAGPGDDGWVLRVITDVSPQAAGCAGSPFAALSPGHLPALRLSLDAPLPATVSVGAPARLVERVRYLLYQGGDSKWYLGFCASASLTSTCATVQPLSGPYASGAAAAGQGGLDLYYFDEDGGITADHLRIARVEIALRGVPPGRHNVAGSPVSVQQGDSVRVAAVVRNR